MRLGPVRYPTGFTIYRLSYVSRYLWDARGCRSGGRVSFTKKLFFWETTKISQTVHASSNNQKANAGREVAKQPRCSLGSHSHAGERRVRFVARSERAGQEPA